MTEEIKEITEEEQKAFAEDIEKVCNHHRLAFIPVAKLKQSMDTGEYTTVVENVTVRLPEK